MELLWSQEGATVGNRRKCGWRENWSRASPPRVTERGRAARLLNRASRRQCSSACFGAVANTDDRRMEPLWSPVVATGGNQSQIGLARKPRKQAKTAAVGCHRLPEGAHGKEHVCHRLPPVAEVPLSVKEGVDLLAPQNAKSCEPEGPQMKCGGTPSAQAC